MASTLEQIRLEVRACYDAIQAADLNDDTLTYSVRNLYGTATIHNVNGNAVLTCDVPRILIDQYTLRSMADAIDGGLTLRGWIGDRWRRWQNARAYRA